jgi:hypothetical protein
MRKFKSYLTIAILLCGPLVSVAAPGPPSSSSGSPSCWPPPCVPIDGGITFLIAAGAAYGAKKIADSRKNQESVS